VVESGEIANGSLPPSNFPRRTPAGFQKKKKEGGEKLKVEIKKKTKIKIKFTVSRGMVDFEILIIR
jgi:hypothetical protein